jgi:LEA14-like dessication related protein
MKKILFVLGIGGIGYALYNYFNKQLALALDWDFKVKGFQVAELDNDGVKLDLIISVLNKSSFALLVKNYDINIIYEDVIVGTAKNNTPFTVEGDSWFDVPTKADIRFSSAKGVLGELGLNLITKKPLLIDVKGDMNVEFGGISKKVVLNVKDIIVTENLSKSVGLSKPIDSISDFLSKLGIKI